MKNHASGDPVLLFDGVCNLCNRWVNIVIDHDPEARVRFASLQSVAGRTLLSRYGYDAGTLNSVVLVDGDHIFQRSDAIIRLSKYLTGGMRLLVVTTVIPRFIRDYFYDLIARHRYSLFGTREQCRLPGAGDEDRFLEKSEQVE